VKSDMSQSLRRRYADGRIRSLYLDTDAVAEIHDALEGPFKALWGLVQAWETKGKEDLKAYASLRHAAELAGDARELTRHASRRGEGLDATDLYGLLNPAISHLETPHIVSHHDGRGKGKGRFVPWDIYDVQRDLKSVVDSLSDIIAKIVRLAE